MKITRILAALFALLVASPSIATTQWPTATGAPGDTSVGSVMFGCENAQGQWVPATAAGQCLGSGGGGSSSSFQPNGLYASLTATASTSVSTALPAGTTTTVRMTNLGAGTVSCTFATGAATGLVNNTQIGPGGSVSRSIGSYDHVACIDQTGSSGSQLVIIEGGTGLGNDTAGGSGGSGGTVVQGNAGSNAQAWWMQIGDTSNGPAAVVTAGANGASNTANGLLSYNRNLVFNGTTWDRWTGAVTVASGAVAPGAYLAGAFVDGAIATLGTEADAVCGTATGTCTQIALQKYLNNVAGNPSPCKAASTWNASTGLTGTQPTGCDGSAALWGDIGAVGGTGVGTFGTPPGAVPAVPVNAYPNLGTLALGSTFVKGTTAAMTGTAATQIIAAVASKVLYVTRVKCNNSSGTATLVQITDGSAGTVLDTLAAGATYGGEQGTGSTPLFWTTSGNGLFAQDVTTGASVICTASGYSG